MRWRIAGFLVVPAILLAAIFGWLYYRSSRFDHIISMAAARHGLEFHLIKAIIYEESWFRPEIRGSSGEFGLMQVSMGAARDYSTRYGYPEPTESRLLEPELNVEIGCWYLKRSLERYKDTPAPLVFALVRYNAGESRADAWRVSVKSQASAPGSEPEEFCLSVVDFPKTREYVRRILRRCRSRRYIF